MKSVKYKLTLVERPDVISTAPKIFTLLCDSLFARKAESDATLQTAEQLRREVTK